MGDIGEHRLPPLIILREFHGEKTGGLRGRHNLTDPTYIQGRRPVVQFTEPLVAQSHPASFPDFSHFAFVWFGKGETLRNNKGSTERYRCSKRTFYLEDEQPPRAWALRRIGRRQSRNREHTENLAGAER